MLLAIRSRRRAVGGKIAHDDGHAPVPGSFRVFLIAQVLVRKASDL